MFECLWLPEGSFGCCSSGAIHFVSEMKSLTGLELTEQARLATVPKDLPVPTFPVLGSSRTASCRHSQLFMWALGIHTQVLTLMQQTFYWLFLSTD